jgi:hypothetical protein
MAFFDCCLFALRNLELTNMSASSQSKLPFELVRVWESKGLPPIQHSSRCCITGDSNAASRPAEGKELDRVVRLELWRSIGAWPVHYDGLLKCGRVRNYGIRGISTALIWYKFSWLILAKVFPFRPPASVQLLRIDE